ncbi:prepilin peptidase [Pseudoduganella eburnea]|uniref:Prepilin leader peptidase/N-methyltransferase n=1 Tax=Massilia eburnea TaxID=1776165 RepID=A0A6L6QMA8_9BURK|nr:A24 family peptidase [Massilia eburnea]MTW13300.1 prepilin peptidase [Massilia eburnea]
MQETLMLFSPPATLAAAVVAGILGLLIGSFLNVVIHRLPIMMQREVDSVCACERDEPEPHPEKYNLVVPRSACPHCGHQITALENVPVISWLVLGGKCSSCKAKISARYPVIEAVSALLSAGLVWHFGFGWEGMAALVFGWLLLAMTFIDIDTQLLPDDLTFPLLWLGLLVNVKGMFVPLQDAVLGAAAGYMVLWTVYWVFKLLRGKEGMGYGDFKLLAALGAWMGWQMLPAIILLSAGVGSVIGIAIIIASRMGFDHKIPFGPYLAGAGLVALLCGQQITAFIYGVTG